MIQLIPFIYLTYSNTIAAREKGLNPILWTFITITSMLFCAVAGGIFVISAFCMDSINLSCLLSFNVGQRLAASQQLQQAISGNPLHPATIVLFAIGGYLLIRYRLEQDPGKNTVGASIMESPEE